MSNNAVARRGSARPKAAVRISQKSIQKPARVRRSNAREFPKARFDDLWRRCAGSSGSAPPDIVQEDLRRRLGGADRRFHNLHHIYDCLRRFDDVASLLSDRDAVELALWFHDAVYTPSDPANERLSAELFLAQSKGADPVFRRRVCALILATRHQTESHSHDRRFIEDIDLAGFGSPWDEFMREGDLLREEFAAQSDERYYAGQVCFLARLKRRPWFFATEYFRDRYESQAQANLDRLLALRAKQGYQAA